MILFREILEESNYNIDIKNKMFNLRNFIKNELKLKNKMYGYCWISALCSTYVLNKFGYKDALFCVGHHKSDEKYDPYDNVHAWCLIPSKNLIIDLTTQYYKNIILPNSSFIIDYDEPMKLSEVKNFFYESGFDDEQLDQFNLYKQLSDKFISQVVK